MDLSGPEQIYTVSQLNQVVRGLLEQHLFNLRVDGEISNLVRPASGHLYFSLKDAASQVRCVMFRGSNRGLGFAPQNGDRVTLSAHASLYTTRGEFQLIVERMEPSGEGALRAAFERLKARLQEEGLFDPIRKQALPPLPARIGVITSPSGAAIRDILHVLRRRFAAVPVLIYPTSVQGETAPGEIAAALGLAGRRGDCEVLIVARGGGSLEDLQAFNDERVARAIAACPLPVVTGIGHETDFTIADFIADLRAPTPSAAAEAVTPDQHEWRRALRRWHTRLSGELREVLEARRQRLHWLRARLRHPAARLRDLNQRLDNLSIRLVQAFEHRLLRERHRAAQLGQRLSARHPGGLVDGGRRRVTDLQRRQAIAWKNLVRARRAQLASGTRALHAVSPLATLERGYAILSLQDGTIVQSREQVRRGDRLTARLGRGRLAVSVDETLD